MVKKWCFYSFKDIPAHEKRITVSTMLTLLRIALVPFIVGSMIAGAWGCGFWLFVLAAITDVLDGNVARWYNEQTFLGACLDPIADKVLLVACFFTLAFVQSPLFTVPVWFVVCVLIKELIVLAGAGIIYLIKGTLRVKPTLLGKAAMLVQTIFIMWLFACYFFHWLPIKTYYCMLAVMLAVVCATLIQYMQIGWNQLTDNE